jgi:hypothetical protein
MRTITREQYDKLVELRDEAIKTLGEMASIEEEAADVAGIQEERDRDWLFDAIWNEVELDYVLEQISITVEEDAQ